MLIIARRLAEDNTILRGVVGSTAHGTGVDGQEDRDEMAIFIEPPGNVCGLAPFDHYIHRDKPEGVRSEPGDLDLTFYSLRKFCRLATQGNPSVLILLWLPEYMTIMPAGRALVEARHLFVSRESGERFLGYLVAQRMKLTGERAKTVSRPDLVARYGYDTKFAMHALRLGYQGIEYLTYGRITLPVPEPARTALRAVRHGEVPFNDALTRIGMAEAELRDLVEDCTIEADRDAIDSLLVGMHMRHWRMAA